MMNSWKCLLLGMLMGVTSASLAAYDNCSETDRLTDAHHVNGPRIFPCQKEITLNMGQNYTLTCQGKTEIKFKQQDIPEEKSGDFMIINRTSKSDNPEYKYEISLDLINVDRYAIGYYACMDVSVKESIALNNLIEEPKDTESVTYIYIYVNGTDSLFAPMREFVTCKSNYYIVECRPTTPDVEVSLKLTQSKPPKNKWYSPKIGYKMKSLSNSACACQAWRGEQNSTVIIRNVLINQQNLSKPTIVGTTKEYLKGESFTLNCTVQYSANSALNMTWSYPNDNIKKGTITEQSNFDSVSGGLLYSAITVTNASKEHEGYYTCFVNNNCADKSTSHNMKFLTEAYLKLSKVNNAKIIEHRMKTLGLSVEIDAYPPATYSFFKNNVSIKSLPNYKNYRDIFKKYSSEAVLTITNVTVEDTANYTILANNGFITKNTTFDVRILASPNIYFGNSPKTCVIGTRTTIQCEVTGYPLPEVTWMFNGKALPKDNSHIESKSLYREVAYLNIRNCIRGNITCLAKNSQGVNSDTKELVVDELFGGLGIINQSTDRILWYPENHDLNITCLASKHRFNNVTWVIAENQLNTVVEYPPPNQYSHLATLKINRISLNQTGNYTCTAIGKDGAVKTDTTRIIVEAREVPTVVINSTTSSEVHPFQAVHLSCRAEGVPRPTIEWLKDDQPLSNETNLKLVTEVLDHKTVNSSILILKMQETYGGTYKCVALSDDLEVTQTYSLVLIGTEITKYVILIGVIIVIFMVSVIYLTWRDKKRKQRFKKELAKAGLLYFKKGATPSLNPDLGIDEQADLLPYDERFEFSPEKLVLGKQLGAGAFGVVYKAEARGIINAEDTTTVAVKMVKKTADNMYIKALASELKIMIHLGRHINIVNLLGACTKNVVKRELVVIVEYCKFGNIHNYMQRHREVFIDQLSDNNKEHNLGKVNIGYSHSGSTGVQSEYFGSENTQDTFLNSANTNRAPRKNIPNQAVEVVKASESYIQPDWRSNYESDYSYDGRSPRPLTSRDLISWAFQIARGMEYLASRKVLHGDLAARNVLLADDNIVKICDFGLARSMYKNDEYKKKENSPLPVKWLAIECMTDQIFSTQSDVWSFGVVLWELFTLAKTPYPNISPADILRYLLEGHRLNKPPYADDRIYNLMKRCWEQKPTARPSFSQLQEILDSYLEESVRNQYVHLSSAYMDSRPAEQDYLAMVCAPDYNNMVTPSPHHYVNNTKSFFPNTPTKVDDEGYQQMSPVSTKNVHSLNPPSTKFDFDARKFNTRPSEASNGGSELTPMLTLNNLPRSGSDSDHEGPISPYLNVPCPRIDEETDEVFESKQQKNALNSAVTNPIYITLEDEKKPPPISYVNIVPNGLVK